MLPHDTCNGAVLHSETALQHFMIKKIESFQSPDKKRFHNEREVDPQCFQVLVVRLHSAFETIVKFEQV